MRFGLLVGILLAAHADGHFAFVSVLSSEDFILAARVMAYTLQKIHQSATPYLLLYTEDVREELVEPLRAQGVLLQRVNKINTPLLDTHPEKKFQYTKLHLWSLDEYEALIHLDLDTVVLESIVELFRCGSFCASLRHSDMFNSGVFVLRPNRTVYEEMLNSTYELSSYDGGDQGFLNKVFWKVKWAQMFDPNEMTRDSHSIRRLSAVYNYDAGMYYLSSKMLVQPKIIHYTMAFVKPWHWYGYPVFDLNWYWHTNRMEMHQQQNETTIPFYQCVTRSAVLVFAVFAHQLMTPVFSRLSIRARTVVSGERPMVVLMIMFGGVVAAVYLTPLQMLPVFGWSLFAFHFSSIVGIVTATYSKLRFNYGSATLNILLLASSTALWEFVAWNVMIRIKVPGARFLVAIVFLIFFALALYNLLGILMFTPQLLNRLCHQNRKPKSETNEQLNLLCKSEVPAGTGERSYDV